ncbi:hypothetical protein [Synechococcus sp. RSCCF101]|uniref:hypothetical protein n=1 Tax=Synechococcus sp. RSCCF101 TaxID=2511069 RepID=UPI00177EC1CB|nr:hypothetical protein [Synechococcus sp. RSCCF101]
MSCDAGLSVNLERHDGAQRVATLCNRMVGIALSNVGSVVLRRTDPNSLISSTAGRSDAWACHRWSA